MADILLPQKDKSAERKAELERQAQLYKYNYDTTIPLMEVENPLDKNDAAWFLDLFRTLLQIRANTGTMVKKSGLKFEKELVKRDPRNLLEMLKAGKVADYYAPDLGVVLPNGKAKSIEEYTSKIFFNAKVPDIAMRFDSDEQFAYTFLAGPNPNQLQRMKSIPQAFPINNSHFQSVPELANSDLASAMSEGRVYVIDHSSLSWLKPGQHPQGQKYCYAPWAAFAVPSGGGRLYPFAIQCGPTPEGREIYTPRDGYTWKIARNCVLAAHNNHHEVVTHLGLTHLLVDAAVAATRRCLHVRHPVHALLQPHFEGTININIAARTSLIQPGKSVERLVGSDIFDNHKLAAKERLSYSFRGNYLPSRLNRFQVADTKLLPVYPYRDDALIVWQSIYEWVASYIEHYYRSDADVRADSEIQAWAREATNVGKIRDFGVSPGSVRDRTDLTEILTMIIFTAGPQHAAVNFTQGTEMSFTPANPLAGYTPEPKGRGHTEKDWLDNLPPLDVAAHTLSILTQLAGIKHTSLGIYKPETALPVATQLARFALRLKEIEDIIDNRNKSRVPYIHLKPTRIPASINI